MTTAQPAYVNSKHMIGTSFDGLELAMSLDNINGRGEVEGGCRPNVLEVRTADGHLLKPERPLRARSAVAVR